MVQFLLQRLIAEGQQKKYIQIKAIFRYTYDPFGLSIHCIENTQTFGPSRYPPIGGHRLDDFAISPGISSIAMTDDPYKDGAPPVIRWFIIPFTIDISTISPRFCSLHISETFETTDSNCTCKPVSCISANSVRQDASLQPETPGRRSLREEQ